MSGQDKICILPENIQAKLCVAEIIVRSLASLDLNYPEISADYMNRFDEMRKVLQKEKDQQSRYYRITAKFLSAPQLP